MSRIKKIQIDSVEVEYELGYNQDYVRVNRLPDTSNTGQYMLLTLEDAKSLYEALENILENAQ